MSNTVATHPHSAGGSPPESYAGRYPNLVALAGDAELQTAIATNPGADAETLRVLAAARQYDTSVAMDVRVALAANRSTPPDVLRDLATPAIDADVEILIAIAGNPATPLDVYDDIVKDISNEDVLISLANNDAVPADQAMRLLYDSDDDVREAAAARAVRVSLAVTGRPRAAAILSLRRCPEPYLHAIASSPSCPREILADLAVRSGSDRVLVAVAANPVAGPEILRSLAGSPNRYVRCAVAANGNMPLDVARRLRYDDDLSVRIATAKWEHWTASDLEALPDAAHPAIGEAFLRRLAEEDKVHNGWLSERIASNPSAPLDLLDDIASIAASGGDSDTLVALAANPAVGPLFTPGDLYSDPRGSLTL